MPFRAARFRRAALVALAGAGALALSGCTALLPSEAVAPASANDVVTGNGPVFFEESIHGGTVGNAFFGTGELKPITTGDTAGLVRIQDGRFRRPVAVAAKGQWVYVVDADQQAVFVHDRLSGRMEMLANLRGVVGADVADIFVTGDRSVYIADRFGAKVLKFGRDGRLEMTLQDDMNLRQPVAISVDETTGDVYVADGVMDHVLIFNSAGKLWRSIGGRGQGEGEFLNITAMARGPDGVYVTARLGHRAQVLSDDGEFKYAFTPETVVFPNAITVDAGNRVYVSDFFDNKLKLFERGELVASVGGTGAGPGHFKGISDVWVEGGTLYVADSLNGRIQVFRLATGGIQAR